MKVKMVALTRHHYNTRVLLPGDEFDVPATHVKFIEGLKRGKRKSVAAPEVQQQSQLAPVITPPKIEQPLAQRPETMMTDSMPQSEPASSSPVASARRGYRGRRTARSVEDTGGE